MPRISDESKARNETRAERGREIIAAYINAGHDGSGDSRATTGDIIADLLHAERERLGESRKGMNPLKKGETLDDMAASIADMGVTHFTAERMGDD